MGWKSYDDITTQVQSKRVLIIHHSSPKIGEVNPVNLDILCKPNEFK